MIIAVFGTFFCRVGLLLLGIYEIYAPVHWAFHVLGLYQLFIDRNISLPPWLSIADFDDLKRPPIFQCVSGLGTEFGVYPAE